MIKFAAIRDGDLIFIGKRHHNCIATMIDCGYPAPISEPKFPQGFVTSDGKFVDRKEAAQIALENRQIEKLKYSKTDLYSEDLY